MGYAKMTDEFYCRWYDENDPTDEGLSDDNISWTYELLTNSKYIKCIFYDTPTMPTLKEFTQWVKDPNKLFFMLFLTNSTPYGLLWLTNPSPTGHISYCHFSTFPLVPVDLACKGGKEAVKFIGRTTRIRQLVGITPLILQGAVKFVNKAGFKKLAVLKKMVYCLGKERDVMLSLCNIEELD